MKKVYLVDSENVGDVWVPLLVQLAADEHVIVFYTQKSPHMSYENVRLLKETDREAEFIKCFEGSNALDFQLVTELGYRLSRDETCEYVIVSNDTGFDAVVRYWVRRGMPVSRLSGKDCHKQLTQQTTKRTGRQVKKNLSAENAVSLSEDDSDTVEQQSDSALALYSGAALDSEATAESESVEDSMASSDSVPETASESHSETSSESMDMPEAFTTENDPDSDAGDEGIRKLCCCIGNDNLADFHNALVMLYGEEEGKDKYQHIKSDPKIAAYWKEIPAHSQEEKFDIYCQLVFAKSDIAVEDVPEDFAAFLWKSSAKRKNLNSLRAALQSHYGKERGMKYYSLFKSHIKILNRM